MTDDLTTNELRLTFYWVSMFSSFQWQFKQARRGLLPSYSEVEMGRIAASYFTLYRSFEGWWESSRRNFSPGFAEWVDEQRAKATGQEA